MLNCANQFLWDQRDMHPLAKLRSTQATQELSKHFADAPTRGGFTDRVNLSIIGVELPVTLSGTQTSITIPCYHVHGYGFVNI